MKFPKLFVSALIGCVLVGASGAAMARNDCPAGSIVGEELDELVIDDESTTGCTVVSTIVNGDVRVSLSLGQGFVMKASVVHGNLQVSALEVSLVDNNVEGGGNLAVGSTAVALVFNNVVSGGGNLGVIDVIEESCEHGAAVFVMANLVLNGNLEVACNKTATVRQNTVTNGDIECSDNIELDSVDNQSLGGTVSCSRSFEQEEEL